MVRIYGIICPETGCIRYIGKTVQPLARRLSAHMSEARTCGKGHKSRWLMKYERIGLLPSIWLLEEVEDGTKWQDRERAWIRAAIAQGLSLINKTEGGDGLHFLKEEDASRFRANVGESVRKRSSDIQYLRKKGEGSKRAWDIGREKYLAAFSSPMVREKHSARAKRCWDDPGTRARLMNRWTPERREAQAEVIRKRATPEYRALMAEKTKQRWAKTSPEVRAQAMQALRDRKGRGR